MGLTVYLGLSFHHRIHCHLSMQSGRGNSVLKEVSPHDLYLSITWCAECSNQLLSRLVSGCVEHNNQVPDGGQCSSIVRALELPMRLQSLARVFDCSSVDLLIHRRHFS